MKGTTVKNLKKKFDAVKSKAKKHAPELTGAGIVIATAVATIVVKNALDSRHSATPRLHEDDLEWVRQEDADITYSIDGHDYRLGYIGTTPDF